MNRETFLRLSIGFLNLNGRRINVKTIPTHDRDVLDAIRGLVPRIEDEPSFIGGVVEFKDPEGKSLGAYVDPDVWLLMKRLVDDVSEALLEVKQKGGPSDPDRA